MQLIIGLFIGFIVSFLVIKRSISKTGYGELKVCKQFCPYYRSCNGAESDDDV